VEWLAETVGAATPELVAAARALFERYVEVVRTLSGERTDVTSLLSRCGPVTSWPTSSSREDRQNFAGRETRCPSVARRTGADATRDHPASADPERDRTRALDQSGGNDRT
jgi:hypothetical protein